MASSAAAVWLKGDDLRCSICLDLLVRPATLLCGHSFCLGCLQRWAEGKAREGRSCPNCQRAFLKRLPDRNVLLEAVLEQYRRAAGQEAASPAAPLPPPAARFPPQASGPGPQDKVKIDEISEQVNMIVEAVSNIRKDGTEMKDYVSRIKSSISEDFSVMKKYISDQEKVVQEVLDQECRTAEQNIDGMIQPLAARIDMLLELQKNSEELLKTTSPEQKVCMGFITTVDEVRLDVQKINSVLHAVTKFKRLLLEMPPFWNYPQQMLQDPSPGTGVTSEILIDVEQHAVASSSNSSVLQGRKRRAEVREEQGDVCLVAVPHIEEHFHGDVTETVEDMQGVSNVEGTLMGECSATEARPSTSREEMCTPVTTSRSLDDLYCAIEGMERRILAATQPQDTHQDTSGYSSSVESDGDSSMPVISSQFSRWATNVTFDLERIHDKLEVTENKRKVTVSRFPCEYERSSKRFRISQVMGNPSFSEGCHYWEVSTKDSTGWAIGVAVGEIGSRDQLGRTELSWCIEWSNEKLSAWHKGQDIQISEEKPLRVGTLLDISKNCLSFYSCTGMETCLHTFEIKTASHVYPAFWIFGGGIGEFLTIYNSKRS